MNSRTRVQNILDGQPVDRIPIHDAFWEDTLALWKEQGLGDADPCDFFEMDFDAMFLDLSGRFEQKLLEQDDRLLTVQDRAGYIVRKFVGKSRSMDFLDHFTKSRDDWESLKKRMVLDPDGSGEARLDDRSYFMHLAPYPTWDEALAKFEHLRRRERFMLFHAYGPWEAAWRHRGMETLLLDVALTPDWVREMTETHVDLMIECLEHCLCLGAKPDGLFLADDFGHTGGLFLSPESWREIFKPSYVRLSEFLHGNSISLWLHSCGDVRMLIPDLIESGVDVLQPLQAAAGMDFTELVEVYDEKLVFFGNISASSMSGPPDVLEKEIREKISLGRDRGGYIYHSDHSVPPEVSFERYQQIMQWIRRHGDCGK
jgi:uroporphyrinogen decarboxylase